jgi:hypothetical protein
MVPSVYFLSEIVCYSPQEYSFALLPLKDPFFPLFYGSVIFLMLMISKTSWSSPIHLLPIKASPRLHLFIMYPFFIFISLSCSIPSPYTSFHLAWPLQLCWLCYFYIGMSFSINHRYDIYIYVK